MDCIMATENDIQNKVPSRESLGMVNSSAMYLHTHFLRITTILELGEVLSNALTKRNLRVIITKKTTVIMINSINKSWTSILGHFLNELH
jgi:hypothetical protein